jgi:GT2 family glycosyltransferase
MSKSVSVIVPSYQGEKRLVQLLEALSRQVATCDWEVVVVLDGSTDSSEQILNDWMNRLPLRFIPRKHNLGRSATLNEGFAAASKQVLVRCDDDLVPAPNYIQLFSDLLTENPAIGVVGLYKNNFPVTRYSKAYGEIVDRRFASEAYATPASGQWHFWAGNCAVTRETFDAIGNYDEAFREYGWEDVDWGYRLAKAGHSVLLEPRLETTHNVAAVTTAGRCERARWSGRASVRFNKKHAYVPPKRDSSTWNRLVQLISYVAGKNLGKLVDWLLPISPANVSLKLVDLAVQAAYLRGVREAS